MCCLLNMCSYSLIFSCHICHLICFTEAYVVSHRVCALTLCICVPFHTCTCTCHIIMVISLPALLVLLPCIMLPFNAVAHIPGYVCLALVNGRLFVLHFVTICKSFNNRGVYKYVMLQLHIYSKSKSQSVNGRNILY